MRNLPDWIDSYMKFTDNSEPPASFRRWVAISTIAAALQRKCFLPWGSLTFFPNLYVILIAPPGKARKGTAMGPGLDLLSEPGLNITLAAEAVTREALIRRLKNCNTTHFNTVTNELVYHSSLTVYSQELTVFLGYNNIQLLGDLNDWYDCRKQWTYETKGSGIDIIHGVYVNMIGATTPALIQSAVPMVAVGGGFFSRVIFVFESEKEKVVIIPLETQEDLQLREHLYKDLEEISMLGGRFKFGEDYVKAYAEWRIITENKPPPFKDERFSGYFERRPATISKLSMIVNTSRTSSMFLEEEDLLKAVSFLEDDKIGVERNMSHALSGLGRSNYASILPQIMIEIATRKECSVADLMRLFIHDITKWDLDVCLESLMAQDFCTYIHNTGKIVYNKDFE